AAVHRLARLAELRQELPVARELEDVRVALPVATDPDVVAMVNGDAVVRRRPGVALAFTAPGPHEVALRIELQHRRCRRAAVARRRILRETDLRARIQRLVAM